MTSLSPAILETHLLYLMHRLLNDQSKDVLSKLTASATGSMRCQLHVNQTLYLYARTAWDVDIDFSTMSSSLGAVTAVTWEDMLKWYFGKYSNATQTIINKVISEEFE